MKECVVKITSECDGTENMIEAAGRYSCVDSRATVEYLQDGDPVVLCFDSDYLYMERPALGIVAEFHANGSSKMTITAGGRKGEIPVSNVSYRFDKLQSDVRIALSYELSFGDLPQLHSLLIIISFSEQL